MAQYDEDGSGGGSSTSFSPDDELDLSGAGLTEQEADFVIEKYEVVESQAGQRWQVTLRPVTDIDGLPGGTARDSGYLTHDSRPELVGMGKGALKRLFKAALGRDKGRGAELEGRRVRGRIREDDNGFARVDRYKAAKGGGEEE